MKFLTSIRPGAIAKRANKKLGSAKNFISGSSFFGKRASQTGGSGLGGLAQGKVKAAPNGISSLISNISQTIGGDTNNVNITKLIGDKVSQSVNKISGNLPNFDGIMSSLSGISDYMKSFTDPSMLDGLASGFSSVKSSLEGTIDLVSTVQKVITKLVKQLNDLKPGKGGGGGGLLGGLGMGLAGLAGGGAMAAAGKKGLGFAKFLSSKKSLALMGLGAVGASAMGASQAQAADISTEQRMLDAPTGDGMPSDQVALFNSTVSKFEKYLEDAKKKRSSGPGTKGKGAKSPNPPTPPGSVDYSNLKSGDISTMAGKSAVLYDEFRNLGYTDEGAKRLIAEIGREGGMQNKNLFGTHLDPKAGIQNTGMFSWNDTRRDALIADAKRAGVWDESKGQLKETAEALRFQARFAAGEIKSRGAGVPEALTTPGFSGPKISELLRDKYVVYDPSYAGGTDPQYGSAHTADWYKRLAPGLEKTYKPQSTLAAAAQTQLNLTAQTQLQQLGSLDPLDAQATFQQPQPQGAAGLTILPLPPAPPPKPTAPAPTPQVTTAPAIPFLSTGIADPNQAAACAIYNICPK